MQEQEYAGFWVRCGATFIDVVLMGIVFIVPLLFIYGEQYFYSDKIILGFWDLMLTYIAPFILTLWFWIRFLATPGKMATKLKVVDARTGGAMSLGQAIGRYFAYIIAALPLGLGVIWVGVDKKKQGWHDKLAGTVVVKVIANEKVKFGS